MNGNLGIPHAVVGETYNKWISFGVASESYASHKHIFSGTVSMVVSLLSQATQ